MTGHAAFGIDDDRTGHSSQKSPDALFELLQRVLLRHTDKATALLESRPRILRVSRIRSRSPFPPSAQAVRFIPDDRGQAEE